MTKSKKNSTKKPVSIVNRRAKFDYELGDELVVGIVLDGKETRAARDGHIQLKGSYVTIRNSELWLNNSSFSVKINERGKAGERTVNTEARKLLATRKQIESLAIKKKDGTTIVPLKLLTNGRFIKLVIAVGKGKKRWDKRETIKKRDLDREHSKMINLRQ